MIWVLVGFVVAAWLVVWLLCAGAAGADAHIELAAAEEPPDEEAPPVEWGSIYGRGGPGRWSP